MKARSTRTAKKSTRFRLAKQQLCSCITLFDHLHRHCTNDYEVKIPNSANFTFCAGREHKTTTFFFFS